MAAGSGDTIVAAATPWGRSAVGLVRLSGPRALEIAQHLSPDGPAWRPRRAALRRLHDSTGGLLDEALVTWMPGPGSATGEDMVELGCHGNPVVVAAVIDACVAAGARPAGPGEYTRRALEHGRIDLLGAEAVDAVVRAASLEGVRLARGAEGVSRQVQAWREALVDLAAEVEADLDYPGEVADQLGETGLTGRIEALAAEAQALAATWGPARARVEGARIALVGAVNAGKSSLFNALLGERRALVSPEAGTTRDVVEARMDVDGLPLVLLDTAGERPEASALERAGLELAREQLTRVDLVLVVTRLDQPPDPVEAGLRAELGDRPCFSVGTHLDRVVGPHRPVDHAVSATTGDGIAALRQALARSVDLPQGVAAVLLSERQHALVRALAEHLDLAADALAGVLGPVVAAEELTRALARLDELTGADTREDVLDRLFARFCIGK